MSAFLEADVLSAIYEAERFLVRAKAVRADMAKCKKAGYNEYGIALLTIDTKKTAAMKRASMDLTRALAELRRVRF